MPRARPASASFALLLLASASAARDAGAQWRAELELSGARLRQEERATTGAVTFGAIATRQSPRAAVDLVALGTFGDGSQRTTQALGSAAWLGGFSPRLRWSLGASGSLFAEPGSTASVSGYLSARQQLLLRDGGAWAGVSVGGVSDRGDPFPVRSVETGLWRGSGAVQGMLSATLVDTKALCGCEIVGGQLLFVSEPATYTDAGAQLRWEPARADGRRVLRASAQGGLRFIARGAAPGDPHRKSFGSVDLELPIVAGFSVSAAYGRQLSDLGRGTPASRYAAVGLRLNLRDLGRAPAHVAATAATSTGPRVELERGEPTRLVVDVPSARQVEVTGTFTAWEPAPLERRGERWVYAGAIASGTHRLLVRIDGGAWTAPSNLPSSDDGDGMRAALLVVP